MISDNYINTAAAFAALTFTLGVAGLAFISSDSVADNRLEGEVNVSVINNFDSNTKKSEPDEIITPENFSSVGLSEDIQLFVTAGSTYGDYCLIGKSPSNLDGFAVTRGSPPQSVLDAACDNKELTLIAGPESIESDNLVKFGISSFLLTIGSFVSGLGTLLVGWVRRDPFATYDDSKKGAVALKDNEVYSPKRVDLPRVPLHLKDNRTQLQADMEEIIMEWSSYEMDPVKVLDYPMVTNMSFAPTSNFHLAMIRAKNGFKNREEIAVIRSLVTDFEHAYKVMISEAERMKWNQFSAEEQSHLRTAQRLLNIAMNSAASPNERNAAYKRLLREVEGIITLTPASILELESKVFLRIDSANIPST